MERARVSESLSRFLKRESTTLDTCASEPLHLSGAIQAQGILLAVSESNDTVVAVSENAPGLMGIDPDHLAPGASLGRALPALAAELERAQLPASGGHYVLSEGFEHADTAWDAVAHRHDGHRFIELIPNTNPDPQQLRARLRTTQQYLARIIRAPDFLTAAQLCAEAVRAITGLARVKIYEFMPDWSGHVIAEDRAEHMPSYLGLFFPESDIPRQARHLYDLLPSRAIASTDDAVAPIRVHADLDSLDLTYSLLRSVSTMHTAYLRNMDIHSSLSVGLRHNEQLWGLIACHHDKPGTVPMDVRDMVQSLGEALMAHRHQTDLTLRSRRIEQMRIIEAAVAMNMRDAGDIRNTLESHASGLRRILDADGFALEYAGDVYTDGVTPPAEFVQELVEFALRTSADDTYQTSNLVGEYPAAAEFADSACGILVQPVKLHRTCQLVWFRGPMAELATWAGDPTAKQFESRPDGTHVLSPRNSFDHWQGAHSLVALPWNPADIETAQRLFQEILDLVAYQTAQIQELSEAHSNLATFTHSTVHDIRGPLRTIEMALEANDENSALLEDVEFRERLVRAASVSVERLGRLVDQVLTFISVGEADFEREPVALAELLDDIETMLEVPLREAGAGIERGALGTLTANRPLLTTAIQNLVTNALTYRHPERPPRVRVDMQDLGHAVEIGVADNGIGVHPRFADRIFEPFKRLHRHDEIEGTGIGLATVRRIASLHQGRAYLDTQFVGSSGGARFVIALPREALVGSVG